MPIIVLTELGKTPNTSAYYSTALIDGIYTPDANATLVPPPMYLN